MIWARDEQDISYCSFIHLDFIAQLTLKPRSRPRIAPRMTVTEAALPSCEKENVDRRSY